MFYDHSQITNGGSEDVGEVAGRNRILRSTWAACVRPRLIGPRQPNMILRLGSTDPVRDGLGSMIQLTQIVLVVLEWGEMDE